MAWRVALVDEDREFRTLESALLGAEPDFEIVGEAGDGAEAAEVVRATQPDVVLVDIDMPRLGGLAAMSLIHSACEGAAIVVLTGSGPDSLTRAASAAGADGFMTKDLMLGNRLAPYLRSLLKLRAAAS